MQQSVGRKDMGDVCGIFRVVVSSACCKRFLSENVHIQIRARLIPLNILLVAYLQAFFTVIK
jgi:hypothetical protein